MSQLIDLFFYTKERLQQAGVSVAELDGAHIMEVADNIHDTVMEIHVQDSVRLRENPDVSPPPIPVHARPPAPRVAVSFPFLIHEHQKFYFLSQKEDGVVEVFLLTYDCYPRRLGVYTPGEVGVATDIIPDKDEQQKAGTVLFLFAALFDLLNTPKFTTRAPLASRQIKKRLARRGVSGAERWNKITWNLSKPKAPSKESQGGGWKMPLHYTRGHWRRSDRAKKNVHVLRDGNTYQWIEGFWSGHPAYGVNKSYYSVVDKEEEK